MEILISETKQELGAKAAQRGAGLIRAAILHHGKANIIVATGASQFEMLNELVNEDVDWMKVTDFHLDEYIGIPEMHPASFRRYLKEKFVDLVSLREFVYVNGNADPYEECRRQQMGEGWFPSIKEVPETAISMSVRQIMKSKAIICSVPDRRKSAAVFNTVFGEISPACPATVLRNHPDAVLYLDRLSAELIRI